MEKTEINLDFRYYTSNKDVYYEMESKRNLGDEFGHGFATPDFIEFLNYLLSFGELASKGKLPPLYNEKPTFIPRFHITFPENEKTIVERILNLQGIKTSSDDLTERIEESMKNVCTLIEPQTDEERFEQGQYIPD